MQLLEISIFILVFGIMFLCFRAFKADMETQSSENSNDQNPNFWNADQIFIAAYISRYLEKSKANEKILSLLYKSIGRSNSAIARKVSRFDHAYSKPNDLSHLDNNIHENIEKMSDFEAFTKLIRSYERLGGNSRVLENHLL